MTSTPDNGVIIIIVTGTIALLLMVVFGLSFIVYYHKRRRESIQEKQILQENYQHELLQSQIEIQNQTLQQIANDLHDNIGQLLTVVVMRLNSLEDEVIGVSQQQSVQQTRELVRTIIADVRTLSKTLDHDTVRRFGLLPCLSLELERIQRAGRINTQLTTMGEPYLLGEQTETVLLRMTQESLNNALKHARATKLHVMADFNVDSFSLTIADDGQGFSVQEAIARQLHESGAGLNSLFRRAGMLGGTCTISSPGTGTKVHIRLPRN